MKLEDCKVDLKVKVLDKTIHGKKGNFPALDRGWGYITKVYDYGSIFLGKEKGNWSESGAYSPNDLEPYIEPEETEYRQLKDITPRAILGRIEQGQGRYRELHCFMQEFTRFVNTFELGYNEILLFEQLEPELNTEPEWTDWLVKHGFIERVVEEKPKEVTYTYGNKLVNEGGEKAGIVQTEPMKVCIIHDSNRWINPIIVSDVTRITAKEFKQMNGCSGTWRKDK